MAQQPLSAPGMPRHLPPLLQLLALGALCTLCRGASLGLMLPARGSGGAALAGLSRLTTDDFLAADAECVAGGDYDYPKCTPGYWCVGTSPPRCKRRSVAGGPCGTEYATCGALLECVRGACAARALRRALYLDIGQPCGAGSHRKCLPGLWCVQGNCARLSACGSECDPPRTLCRAGLRCAVIRFTAVKICVRAFPAAAPAARTLQPGDACGKAGGKRCVRGARCVAGAGGHKCRKVRRVGEKCAASEECEWGASCAGDGVCVVLRAKGQSCDDDVLAVCKDGACVAGKCEAVMS